MKKYIEFTVVATGETYTVQYDEDVVPIIGEDGVWNDDGVWIDEEIMFNE
jgi:hypothetical protein